METPAARDEVAAALEGAVETTRRWSREQAPLWRRIPEAALEADGVTGYSDRHSYAYHYGFWQLYSSSASGYYRVYVDLSNGELVSSFSAGDYADGKLGAPVRCADADVLGLSLDELDAEKTLAELAAHAARPPFSGYDLEKVAHWREEKRAKLPDVWTSRPTAGSYEEAQSLELKESTVRTGPLSRPSALAESTPGR